MCACISMLSGIAFHTVYEYFGRKVCTAMFEAGECREYFPLWHLGGDQVIKRGRLIVAELI